ncbi:centromere/kinetochore protein zw10 [Episyrphus balteatus]|uniref:centromere/kinetochore protein zw10 n=1 Tax=Episyrphus balteatus TaxID=286459 RepID=UPI00248576D5|nr:centromere/kinetochore protein zw10 [Episyrphus balteatus]
MTSSISQDIIKILNDSDSIDTKRQISKITTETKRYQEKIKSYIETNHVEFLVNLSSNELYLEEGETLIKEVEYLLQNIEGDTQNAIYEANEDLQQYIEELREISIGLRVSCKILRIDDLFQSLEEAKSNKEYLIVMDIVGKLKNLIDDPTDKIFNRLECYHIIKVKFRLESDMLLQNMKKCFDRLVQFAEKNFQNTKSVTLKISKDENQLQDTVLALFNARYNPKKICEFLLDNCFEPIIMKPVSMEFRDDASPDFFQLSLSYSLKDLGASLKPNYKVVFKNIEMLVLCLGHMNVQLSDQLHVFTIFGDQMKERLLSLIVNECLLNAVPETMDEMHESTLVEDILNFHRFLVDSQLINEESDLALVEFTEKVDILFRNRFCGTIMDTAVDIMRKDLHEMTLIAERNTTDQVANNPFLFPRCMVSKSILELIHLMEKIIRHAGSVEGDLSEQLISVIPTLIHRYVAEVPTHHEKFLQNIPQQSALFYNNTMFLSHWVTKNSDKGIATFATLVKSLQGLALEHFNSQIRNQRSLLMGILAELDLSDAITALGIAPQKLVGQCLRQLDLLKNVWQNILPDEVYNKTTCSLVNDFCLEVIRKIMVMEDISAKVGDQLAELIGVILEKAPTLFKDNHQIIHVKAWMKLEQLKMILGASLVQITEQWCEGHGILTANYKAEEVKHLIRALFQNTDRRANALASIV